LPSSCERVKTEIRSKKELLLYYKNGTEQLDLLAENKKFFTINPDITLKLKNYLQFLFKKTAMVKKECCRVC
jgi:hypothetical protein